MQHTTGALIPIRAASPAGPDWQPIFHLSNQVVLYNPTSHALSIRRSSPTPTLRNCPYCHRPLRTDEDERDADADAEEFVRHETGEGMSARAHNYFQLLAVANETLSRPGSPPPLEDEGGTERSGRRRRRSSSGAGRTGFGPDAMAEGYFKAFFQEEYKLGMGANGSVYLCQHMLDGNPLGHFAVKKIAVGESHAYLLKILREVRLLERLHHPHIITYHHAWLETCQFSAFGPKVPTLHVLMQWAEGGSLDDFIAVRLGQSTSSHPFHHHPPSSEDNPLLTPANSTPSSTPTRGMSSRTNGHGPSAEDSGDDRAARIRAFRAIQRAPPDQREQLRREFDNRYNSSGSQKPTWTAVHLLSAEEVHSLFRDVVEGLAFLHDKSILHLDLKPGNVLLTWDEGKLVPRAMLSDFGTSRDMLHSSRARSGNTGTLEYTAPESLPDPGTGRLQQVSSQADMWSLGMLLHKLLFFRLPYRFASDGGGDASEGSKMDQLENEVRSYPGFKASVQLAAAFEARRLPRAYLVLLDGLLSVAPGGRPTSERVLGAIREGRVRGPRYFDA
ncbi:hypothetical protein PLICRDRAFT_117648 [Plicaturopsis crispa FD-325 SS-3]|uniref:non-specific serine/threonine protein kinase n=1 Tax=Plicaturopsis crispa FD-325 SS-3 TaxID=944288 RepID=A0A0C9SXU4_PLICR|nr:hypothetical protein PLICRDRAFT_117648 [Plicaturopsis crispa FD-325 SS-3]